MADQLALFFGALQGAGHYLHSGDERYATHVQPDGFTGFGWDYSLLDTGLLKNRKVPDSPDGRVHWVVGGRREGWDGKSAPEITWHGFFWWDRSGDRRSNSNSGFYVRGFGPIGKLVERAPEAFEFACKAWPGVVARQYHPLVLFNHDEVR